MAVDKELLEILCCPDSRVELRELTAAEITAINQEIKQGSVKMVKPLRKSCRKA